VFLVDERSYVVLFVGFMKDTTISLKMESALKSKLLVLAKNENRTLSNFIEKILKEEVAKHERKSTRIVNE
jgi:hypothetical protein